jgi:hypothetical protein
MPEILIADSLALILPKKTLEPVRHRYDPGRAIYQKIHAFFRRSHVRYSMVVNDMAGQEEMEPMVESESPGTPAKHLETPQKVIFLPFRRIFTRNLMCTLLSYTILEIHTTAYNSLWPSFLSDPVASVEERRKWRLPFFFSGGAGMATDKIGWTLAILGAVGLPAQLLIFPRVQQRLGNLRTLRVFLMGFPLVHALLPYIAVVPSSTQPPAGKSGFPVWALIVAIQTILMFCAVFVMPTQVMLINR